MLAQNTHWSSGELRGTPSRVTLMREPPAPLMRIYAVPVPSPFSLHDNTPGVCENRKGSSFPVFEKSESSFRLMFSTANGAPFCAFTPCTTTSCSFSMRSESVLFCCASTVCVPAVAVIIATTVIILFFILFLSIRMFNVQRGKSCMICHLSILNCQKAILNQCAH